MTKANKIIAGLRDAVAGDLARVTIEGKTYRRVETPDITTEKHLKAVQAILHLREQLPRQYGRSPFGGWLRNRLCPHTLVRSFEADCR